MKPLQIAGLVLVILATMGFVSGIAPMWSPIVVLVLAMILLLAGRSRRIA